MVLGFTRVRRYAAPDYSHSSPLPPPFAISPEMELKDRWVGGVSLRAISILVIRAVYKPQSFEEHRA